MITCSDFIIHALRERPESPLKPVLTADNIINRSSLQSVLKAIRLVLFYIGAVFTFYRFFTEKIRKNSFNNEYLIILCIFPQRLGKLMVIVIVVIEDIQQ